MRLNNPLSPRRRHATALCATGIILIITGGVYLSDLEYGLRTEPAERSIKVQPPAFETIAKARLSILQSRTTEEEILKSTGLKTGDYTWDNYVEELNGVYREFFETPQSQVAGRLGQLSTSAQNVSSNETSIVQQIREKLESAFDLSSYSKNASNRAKFHPTFPEIIPHTVFTTSRKSNEDLFPKQFSSWRSLNAGDGWQIKPFTDEDIWRWMTKVFGGGRDEETDKDASDHPRILDIYKQISDGVIRGDFFRYVALLMEGGVYTDTDTACIRPLRSWPRVREDHWELKVLTDPMLSLAPHMFDLVSQTASSNSRPPQNETDGEESRPLSDMEAVKNRIGELKLDLWEPPALVVAVEFDYWGPRAKDSWTHWDYSRGMQIVQSTFMAQPGHPVFLDVLGRIMKDIEKGRAVIEDEAKDDSSPGKPNKYISQERLFDILDFTGPGVFSDCVFRYLMARWGVQLGDLTQASGPVRVGDVLIYPLYSFTSRDGNYGKFQGEHKLVFHEARGSWKGWVSD